MRHGNFYTGAGLDRADRLRREPDWLQICLARSSTYLVATWRSRNLIAGRERPAPAWVEAGAGERLLREARTLALLGVNGDATYVAVDLSHLEKPERLPEIGRHGRFDDLRSVGGLLPRAEGAILAYARGLMYWHYRHRYCGICGSPAESAEAGHVRRCTNPACSVSHFPRTDPAVIMLVHDGGERCVLGRHGRFLPGMHSTLAGFVEPGESLEEAVAREVEEEVDLRIDPARVTYHSSQPWPFPSSLMLGFHARADYAPLAVSDELESARWFTRAELRASPEDDRFRLPRADSIARRLIEDWLRRA